MSGRSTILRLAILISALGVIAACAVGPAGAPGSGGKPRPTVTLMPTLGPVTPTETSVPTPTVVPRSALLAQEIGDAKVQPFDAMTWLSGVDITGGTPMPTAQPLKQHHYSVGSVERFYLGSLTISARLVYQNKVVNMWVESGLPVSASDAAKAANIFADKIYPTDRQVFGDEANPGIDDDPRVNILTALYLGPNIAGYFAPSDEYTTNVYPYSNQKEMFYMSWFAADVGSDDYMSTLAHEFQHMIQWNEDRNEAVWLNEGLSQVAERINGYNTAFTHFDYLFNSQVQLNSWSQDFRQSYANYGAGYLYLLYIDERYGNDTISAIAHSPLKSLASVDEALAAKGTSVNDVFSDWIVANYVNDTSIEDGRYGYKTEKLIPVCPRRRLAENLTQPPHTTMKQYSANYVELEGAGDFTIDFQGDTEVQVIPTNPVNGDWLFWSNVGDNSNMTLTHEFDLTSVAKARLQYNTWYDMSERDSGGVEISTDSGQHWELLKASSSKPDPDLGTHVPDYSGGSGGSNDNPLWLQETADMSDYAGKKVLVRFDYVTSGKSTGSGWAVDNIRVPEIGYSTDFESDDGGWQSNGWVRSDNKVQQKWTVSIVQTDGGTTVTRLPLDGKNSASTSVSLPAGGGKATIIIGAMAPWTHVPARYSLKIGGTGKMISLKPPPGILFQEDFQNACSSFDSFILPDYRFGYQNGIYEMEIKSEDTNIVTQPHMKFDDIVLDVDVTQVKVTKDSSTGVMCRFQDINNFYLFTIGNDGKYEILVADRGRYRQLVKPTSAPQIHTGEGATNHLRVACDKTKLALSINGDLVKTVEDSTIRAGDIGLTLSTNKFTGTDEQKRKTSVVTDFDNLVVKRP